MAFGRAGGRDLLFVIRAQDQASHVIARAGVALKQLDRHSKNYNKNLMQIGSGLSFLGVGFTVAGALGLKMLGDLTDAAVEYGRQSALTYTQVDDDIKNQGVSLNKIRQIGIDVANDIPIAFREVQDGLFDIFSSMEVGAEGAEKILRGISKAAVAGQTDVRTAARSTIAIMNAYGDSQAAVLGLTVDSTEALDFQFQLVRKGIGTYAEFANVLGRALPAFASMGQHVDQLGGALVFMTRRGLSPAMAATSAARAIELIGKPESVANLEAMGIKVRNARGEFLQLDDIVTQLGQNFGQLTGPERRQKFVELFGTGTIQARRFFDFAITGWQEFAQAVDFFTDKAGTLDKAYQIMFEDPALVIQKMKNRIEILKESFGRALIPVLLTVVEIVTRVIDRFNKLSDETKSNIAKYAVVGSVFLTIFGAVMTLIGGLLALKGILVGIIPGIKLGGVLGVLGGSLGAFIATVALLKDHWRGLFQFVKVTADLIAKAARNPIVQWGLAAIAIYRVITALQALQRVAATSLILGRGTGIGRIQKLGLAMGFLEMATMQTKNEMNKFGKNVEVITRASGGFRQMWTTSLNSVKAAVAGLFNFMLAHPIITALAIIGAKIYTVWQNSKKASPAVENFVESFDALVKESPARALDETIDRLKAARKMLKELESGPNTTTRGGKKYVEWEGMLDRKKRKEAIQATKNDIAELERLERLAKIAFDQYVESLETKFPQAQGAILNYVSANEALGKTGEEIEEALKAAEDLAKGIEEGFSKAADVTDKFAEDGAISLEKWERMLRKRLNDARKFYENYAKAVEKGIDPAILNQIALMGPVEGGRFMAALVEGDVDTAKRIGLITAAINGVGGAMGALSMATINTNQKIGVLMDGTKFLAQAFVDAEGNITALVRGTKGITSQSFAKGVIPSAAKLQSIFGLSAIEAKKLHTYLVNINDVNLNNITSKIETLTTSLGFPRHIAEEIIKIMRNINLSPMDRVAQALDIIGDQWSLTKKQEAEVLRGLFKIGEDGSVKLMKVDSALKWIMEHLGVTKSEAKEIYDALKVLEGTYKVIVDIDVRKGKALGQLAKAGAVTGGPADLTFQHQGGLIRHAGGAIDKTNQAERGGQTFTGLKRNEVPIIGQVNEFMQKAPAVQHWGQPFMRAVNNMESPQKVIELMKPLKMHEGGQVLHKGGKVFGGHPGLGQPTTKDTSGGWFVGDRIVPPKEFPRWVHENIVHPLDIKVFDRREQHHPIYGKLRWTMRGEDKRDEITEAVRLSARKWGGDFANDFVYWLRNSSKPSGRESWRDKGDVKQAHFGGLIKALKFHDGGQILHMGGAAMKGAADSLKQDKLETSSRHALNTLKGEALVKLINSLGDKKRMRIVPPREKSIKERLPKGWVFAEDYSVVPPQFYKKKKEHPDYYDYHKDHKSWGRPTFHIGGVVEQAAKNLSSLNKEDKLKTSTRHAVNTMKGEALASFINSLSKTKRKEIIPSRMESIQQRLPKGWIIAEDYSVVTPKFFKGGQQPTPPVDLSWGRPTFRHMGGIIGIAQDTIEGMSKEDKLERSSRHGLNTLKGKDLVKLINSLGDKKRMLIVPPRLKSIQERLPKGYTFAEDYTVVETKYYPDTSKITPDFFRAHDGGMMRGFGDLKAREVPIIAEVGEFMQQVPAVKYWGTPFMKAVNEMQSPQKVINLMKPSVDTKQLHTGGPVGIPPSFAQGGAVKAQERPLRGAQQDRSGSGGGLTIPITVELDGGTLVKKTIHLTDRELDEYRKSRGNHA